VYGAVFCEEKPFPHGVYIATYENGENLWAYYPQGTIYFPVVSAPALFGGNLYLSMSLWGTNGDGWVFEVTP